MMGMCRLRPSRQSGGEGTAALCSGQVGRWEPVSPETGGRCKRSPRLRPRPTTLVGSRVAGLRSRIEDMVLCSNRRPLSEDLGDRFLLEVHAREKKNLSLLINWCMSLHQRKPGVGANTWAGFPEMVTFDYSLYCFYHRCCCCVDRSVVSDSLQPLGLQPSWLLCPQDSPGKNTGAGCHFFLQGIFPTQGSNPGLLHRRQILGRLSHRGTGGTLIMNKALH